MDKVLPDWKIRRQNFIEDSLSNHCTAIRGISFDLYYRKKLKNLVSLLQGCLRNVETIIIWHAVVSHSLSAHVSNNKQFIVYESRNIIIPFQNKIQAIVNVKRIPLPDIKLRLRKICILILNLTTDLLPTKVQKNVRKDTNLSHSPSVHLEGSRIFQVVI